MVRHFWVVYFKTDSVPHACAFFLQRFECFIHLKSQFKLKNPALPIVQFLFLVPPRKAMLKHLIIPFLFYYLSSGPLRESKYKRKFQTFSSKSGRCRLREVVAYGSKYSVLTWNLFKFLKNGRYGVVIV